MLAQYAAGANPPPAPLPKPPIAIDDWANSQVPKTALPQVGDPFSTASDVWRAIEYQKEGRFLEAAEQWRAIRLPGEKDVWRKTALAMTLLNQGNVEQAAVELAEARGQWPTNAVVRYCTGVLRLMQAEQADEWYDAVGPMFLRLASYPPREIAPNTRSMFELAAKMEFERAVEMAPQVRLDEPLLPAEWTAPDDEELAMPMAAPMVRDVLTAGGMDQFEGKAHLALGELHMKNGSLAHAEEHLDRAALLGLPTGDLYQRLGESYEEFGLHAEATRAFLKAMSHGGGVVRPGAGALQNMRELLHDIL